MFEDLSDRAHEAADELRSTAQGATEKGLKALVAIGQAAQAKLDELQAPMPTEPAEPEAETPEE